MMSRAFCAMCSRALLWKRPRAVQATPKRASASSGKKMRLNLKSEFMVSAVSVVRGNHATKAKIILAKFGIESFAVRERKFVHLACGPRPAAHDAPFALAVEIVEAPFPDVPTQVVDPTRI